MAVAASSQGGLLLRVAPEATSALIDEPHVRRFQMRGRHMDGWLHIDAEAVDEDDALSAWVLRGATYARSLPPK
jgi:hypothetical protein